MTIADDVNALTGNAFHPTLVASNITASTNYITGLVGETVSEGDNVNTDSAITILAEKMLYRSRLAQKAKTDPNILVPRIDELITQEIKSLLNLEDPEVNALVFTNKQPTTYWRV
jgi:hypothetical protein